MRIEALTPRPRVAQHRADLRHLALSRPSGLSPTSAMLSSGRCWDEVLVLRCRNTSIKVPRDTAESRWLFYDGQTKPGNAGGSITNPCSDLCLQARPDALPNRLHNHHTPCCGLEFSLRP